MFLMFLKPLPAQAVPPLIRNDSSTPELYAFKLRVLTGLLPEKLPLRA